MFIFHPPAAAFCFAAARISSAPARLSRTRSRVTSGPPAGAAGFLSWAGVGACPHAARRRTADTASRRRAVRVMGAPGGCRRRSRGSRGCGGQPDEVQDDAEDAVRLVDQVLLHVNFEDTPVQAEELPLPAVGHAPVDG